MDLTPVKIRGKKRKSPHIRSSKASHGPPLVKPERPSGVTSRNTAAKSRRIRRKELKIMPTLEGLPQEILEMIFLRSMNISLPRASLLLGQRLSSHVVTMEYFMRTFFNTVEHQVVNVRNRRIASDPIEQSKLLACRFFTWTFFLAYVRRAHGALIKLRGRIWEHTGVQVPGPTYFDSLLPYKFTKVTYLSFAEGFFIPEKLVHGPWTDDKASLLYVLVSLNGQLDWAGSMAGETAKHGLRQAVREQNERAVAALSVLLGVAQALDTDILNYAVMDCGCNFNIVRHLLYNAQILHRSNGQSHIDFYNPKLWQWAESHEGKGVLLKDLLKKADRFSLEFYLESESDWRTITIVPFPYSGAKYDVRMAFDDLLRELLVRLYRNHGRKITARRALIV